MEIRKVAIEHLNPSPYNPRKELKPGDVEYEQIKRSIEEFDLVEPLVWNMATGNLVGGHQRLAVLREKGVREVDVSVVNIPDLNKEKALNIALNKISGEWDSAKLEAVFKDLSDNGMDVTLTGFDEIDLKNLNINLASMMRPVFEDSEKKKSLGNEFYFYVEFYNDEATFKTFSDELMQLGVLKTPHEIDPEYFKKKIL
jgi:hypothetical protein